MDRREALSLVSTIVGGTVIGASAYLSGCEPKRRKSLFGILDNIQVETLEEIAEVILPKTNKSPGAKNVEIGNFMNSFVTDCYNQEEQKVLTDGILQLNTISSDKFGDRFAKLKQEEKIEFIENLEEESKDYNKLLQPDQLPHYYTMVKQMTILGYKSSELVGTTVLNHVPVPGRYEGCIPYVAGEKYSF